MQTRIVDGRGGVAGVAGRAARSGIASRCVPVPVTRRGGLSKRKQSWCRYGDDQRSSRQISPAAIELTEKKYSDCHQITHTTRRALFYAAQCLSRCHKQFGARLRQDSFSSERVGRVIQQAIVECGLARCVDWDSWKPTGYDLRNAKSRAFVPCVDFLWADTGGEVVSSWASYLTGSFEPRSALHQAATLILPHAASNVKIAANVTAALQRGTGLYCDFPALRASILSLPDGERAANLCATLAAVGRVPNVELRPIWEQHEWGRLYCKKPAAINMPSKLLSSLRSIEDLPLWCVDFSSFELRIACEFAGQALPDDDAYRHIAEPCGLTRERVKAVINPMLHGQTRHQCWYGLETGSQARADRPLIEDELRRSLPLLFAELDQLRRDAAILQREGARVFFACMAEAMNHCEIKSAGLPKHDGWVFAGSESQAKAVLEVFQKEAARLTKVQVHLPAKLESIFLT